MTWVLNRSAALAVKGATKSGDSIRMPCPVHGSKGPTLALSDGQKGAVWHCHANCDSIAVRDALVDMGVLAQVKDWKPPDRSREIERDRKDKRDWCARVWAESGPLRDGARQYYASRGLPWELVQEAAPHVLRWRSTSPPEIVARIVDANGKGVGIHRTILSTPKDRKANGSIKGGMIRLFGSECPTGRLTVSEGIETALAFRHLNPECWIAWSLISADGIRDFSPPSWVRHLTVAADMDGAGLTAFERLERRMEKERPEMEVELRLPGGIESWHRQDWNDSIK